MLTLFPKFKKRMIIFEVVYVALMVTLYVLKPTANPIALALMLIVGMTLFNVGRRAVYRGRAIHQRRKHAQPPAQPAVQSAGCGGLSQGI